MSEISFAFSIAFGVQRLIPKDLMFLMYYMRMKHALLNAFRISTPFRALASPFAS
jgi:hypothetical protein